MIRILCDAPRPGRARPPRALGYMFVVQPGRGPKLAAHPGFGPTSARLEARRQIATAPREGGTRPHRDRLEFKTFSVRCFAPRMLARPTSHPPPSRCAPQIGSHRRPPATRVRRHPFPPADPEVLLLLRASAWADSVRDPDGALILNPDPG